MLLRFSNKIATKLCVNKIKCQYETHLSVFYQNNEVQI